MSQSRGKALVLIDSTIELGGCRIVQAFEHNGFDVCTHTDTNTFLNFLTNEINTVNEGNLLAIAMVTKKFPGQMIFRNYSREWVISTVDKATTINGKTLLFFFLLEDCFKNFVTDAVLEAPPNKARNKYLIYEALSPIEPINYFTGVLDKFCQQLLETRNGEDFIQRLRKITVDNPESKFQIIYDFGEALNLGPLL